MEFHPSVILRISALIIILGVFFGGAVFFTQKNRVSQYPEVAQLSGISWPFQQYADFVRTVAEQKGAPYAYEVMKRVSFPPDVNVHELGHIVGDILYKQKRLEGMTVCTSDFRSACAHSIIIGFFLEHGAGAVNDISNVCTQAPGGRMAYTLCFHGMGHGALAYTNYNLQAALDVCQKVGTEKYHNREHIECSAGAFMELATGAHDAVAWEAASETYFKTDNPLYPCTASFIPEAVRPTCYLYLTPHLLAVAKVEPSAPTDASIAKAFSYCDAIPSAETEQRRTCYAGFGNELPFFTEYKNISAVPTVSADALLQVRAWCALAGDAHGVLSCNHAALELFFWAGQDTKHTSLRYCALAPASEQGPCYKDYGDQIRQYVSGDARNARCREIPEEYQTGCLVPNDR